MSTPPITRLARAALCAAVLDARDAARALSSSARSGPDIVKKAMTLLECCLFIDIMSDGRGTHLLDPRWSRLAMACSNGEKQKASRVLARHPQSVRRLAERLLPELECRSQAAVALIRMMAQESPGGMRP